MIGAVEIRQKLVELEVTQRSSWPQTPSGAFGSKRLNRNCTPLARLFVTVADLFAQV